MHRVLMSFGTLKLKSIIHIFLYYFFFHILFYRKTPHTRYKPYDILCTYIFFLPSLIWFPLFFAIFFDVCVYGHVCVKNIIHMLQSEDNEDIFLFSFLFTCSMYRDLKQDCTRHCALRCFFSFLIIFSFSFYFYFKYFFSTLFCSLFFFCH